MCSGHLKNGGIKAFADELKKAVAMAVAKKLVSMDLDAGGGFHPCRFRLLSS
jgi:hypothetical protein